jgi:hypothetical protein
MATKLAFLFVADHVDRAKHRAEFAFGDVVLFVRGVANYAEAKEMAIELTDQGVTGIELCAGFGNEGTGIIASAVKGKAIVGAVRFDVHPAFGASGDRLFGA